MVSENFIVVKTTRLLRFARNDKNDKIKSLLSLRGAIATRLHAEVPVFRHAGAAISILNLYYQLRGQLGRDVENL